MCVQLCTITCMNKILQDKLYFVNIFSPASNIFAQLSWKHTLKITPIYIYIYIYIFISQPAKKRKHIYGILFEVGV